MTADKVAARHALAVVQRAERLLVAPMLCEINRYRVDRSISEPRDGFLGLAEALVSADEIARQAAARTTPRGGWDELMRQCNAGSFEDFLQGTRLCSVDRVERLWVLRLHVPRADLKGLRRTSVVLGRDRSTPLAELAPDAERVLKAPLDAGDLSAPGFSPEPAWNPERVEQGECEVYRHAEGYYVFPAQFYVHSGELYATTKEPKSFNRALQRALRAFRPEILVAGGQDLFHRSMALDAGYPSERAFAQATLGCRVCCWPSDPPQYSVRANGVSGRAPSKVFEAPPSFEELSTAVRELLDAMPLPRLRQTKRKAERPDLGRCGTCSVDRQTKRTRKGSERRAAKPHAGGKAYIDLIDALSSAGYFRYARSRDVAEVVARRAHPFGSDTGRAFSADAERLAEGGVGAFLESCRVLLEQAGIHLGEVEEEYASDGYAIWVDGFEYELWVEPENAWVTTTERSFALINRWLDEAGSDERFHVRGGGEDQWAVVLTAEQCALLRRSGLFAAKDLPRMLR